MQAGQLLENECLHRVYTERTQAAEAVAVKMPEAAVSVKAPEVAAVAATVPPPAPSIVAPEAAAVVAAKAPEAAPMDVTTEPAAPPTSPAPAVAKAREAAAVGTFASVRLMLVHGGVLGVASRSAQVVELMREHGGEVCAH